MIKGKKIIAIIPVRKNSQGIRNKNLIKIGKYSLLERTILIAKKSKFIDDVVVSTDCKKMFKISKKYKANLNQLRSKNLATSKALTIDVIKDVITKKKIKESYILLLQVSSPTRTLRMTNFFLKKFSQNKAATSSVSLTRILHPHPDKIQTVKNNFVKSYLDKESMVPRELLPKVYCLNGLFYIAESKYIVKKNTFFTKKTSPFFIDHNKSLNLDSSEDIVILKDKIKKKEINQNFLQK
jgi:CMP-N,N'-diacetyllegionaminic acid synthase